MENNSLIKYERLDNILFFFMIFYLMTLIIEGPLRYALSIFGLGTLIYIRDVISSLGIIIGIIYSISQRKKLNSPVIISLYILLISALFSLLIHDISIFSTLFGLKIFSVFLFGMACSDAIIKRYNLFIFLIHIFILITIIGIITNYFVGKFPWEGLSYETSFGYVTTTREWWTDGQRRLPGFARASFDAAMIIGIGTAIIITRHNYINRILILIPSMVSIFLTTTKGMIVALSIVAIWISIVPKQILIFIGNIICILLLFLMFLLPIISCTIQFDHSLITNSPGILSSFAERIVLMWPTSCKILDTPYSWFLGAGIGAIGVPQEHGGYSKYISAADNLFVYLYVNGGIIFSTGIIATVATCLRAGVNSKFDQKTIRALLIVILAYGITTNMQEQPFYAIFAGLLTGYIWQLKEAAQ